MRNRRQLAAVRALWEARDAMARRRDVAPGRILPDSAIVAAVQADPQTPAALQALPVFGGRSTRRHVDTWFGALQAARALPESDLPLPLPVGDGPPQANRWAERDPVAARRLARVRAAVTALADELGMPQENLVQPEAVRRLAWTPPEPATEQSVAAALRAARPGVAGPARRRTAGRGAARAGPSTSLGLLGWGPTSRTLTSPRADAPGA
jgi:ribonuclease D